MAQITPLFAVPLATAMVEDADELNRRLRALFLSMEAQGDAHANKNPYQVASKALFESGFDLFESREPAIVRLRDFCWEHVYQVIRDLNGYDADVLRRLHIGNEAWFHITRRGGSFSVHNHPLHSWSGVYCVCQEGDESVAGSGEFTIINPHIMNTMYTDMATYKLKRPYDMGNVSVRLKPGQLLVFPSWLLHFVSPFEPAAGDGLRITVAFNARFRLEGYQYGQL
jgi:uncharacterized protein (TIGR02466 family)